MVRSGRHITDGYAGRATGRMALENRPITSKIAASTIISKCKWLLANGCQRKSAIYTARTHVNMCQDVSTASKYATNIFRKNHISVQQIFNIRHFNNLSSVMNQGPLPCPTYVWNGCYCRKRKQCGKHTFGRYLNVFARKVIQVHPDPHDGRKVLRHYAGEIPNSWCNFTAYTVNAPCRWPLISFKAAQRFTTVHILGVLTELIPHASKRQWTDKRPDKQRLRDIPVKSDRNFTAPMCAGSLCNPVVVQNWRS